MGQVGVFDFLIDINVLKLLGVANLVFLLLVFFSCRCVMGRQVFEWLWKNPAYQKFYAYHCHLWWGFFISVLAHTLIALALFPPQF